MSSLWAAARSSTRRLTSRRSATASATSSPSASSRCTPELVGGLELAHVVGGGDQRLARHAVGEHRGPAEAVALDDGDLGAEVRGDEGGLVPTGPPTEDDDSARPRAHVAHPTTAARGPPARGAPGPAPPGQRPVNGAGARSRLGCVSQNTQWCCSIPTPVSLECERAPITRPRHVPPMTRRSHDDPLLHPARRRPRHDRLRRGDRGRLLPAQRRRRRRQHPAPSGAVDAKTATSAEAFGGMDALVAAAKKEGALNVIALPAGLGQLRRDHQGLPGQVPRDQGHQRPARREQRRRDLHRPAAQGPVRRPRRLRPRCGRGPGQHRHVRPLQGGDLEGHRRRLQGRRPACGSTTTAAT